MHHLLLLLACTGKPDLTDTGGDGGSVDCPTPSTWYIDADGDAFGAGAPQGSSCERPEGMVANDDDCDDTNPDVNPYADEVCNGIDDDCDGIADPDSALDILTCFQDSDGDGYGAPGSDTLACDCTGTLVDNDDDCDDTDPDAWPGADEVLYDGVDQACDGMEGEYDADGDGYDWDGGEGVDGQDCDDDDAEINPDALDLCDDDIDQDCDGRLDECGLWTTTTPNAAWLRVYRDNEEWANMAYFGNNLTYAGDSDGDGRPEILAATIGNYEDNDFTRYQLVELPAGTSGGEILLEELVTATWEIQGEDGEGVIGAHHAVTNLSVSNVDLDGDGYIDYMFTAGLGRLQDGSDLFLSPGPAAGDVDMSDALTVHSNEVVAQYGPPRMLVDPEPGGGGWVTAMKLWPRDDLEGEDHASIAFLTEEHFAEGDDWTDGPMVYSANGWELEQEMVAEDMDGDGVRDLVVSTLPYKGPEPIGRVLVFLGPFDHDLTYDDADHRFESGSRTDQFGLSISTLDDPDSDGHVTLAVADQDSPDRPDGTRWLIEPTEGPMGYGLASDVSYARIDYHETRRIYSFPARAIGDFDLDGTDDICAGLTYDVDSQEARRQRVYPQPTGGVVDVDDHLYEFTTDEDIDASGTGFGSTVMPGHDLDGDGTPDLLIGEYYWDGLTHSEAPFGRFMVYRGEVAD